MPAAAKPPEILPPQLGVYDVAAITAGIIIGAGIFEATQRIASNVHDGWSLLGMWVLGGLIALNGAFCYAELASAYPHQGGTYVYLNKAFGHWAGFVYAWCEFWVVRPANIGAMAFIFAKYALEIMPGVGSPLAVARVVVIFLGGINLLGVRIGKGTQLVLTAAKVFALLAVCAAGLYVFGAGPELPPAWTDDVLLSGGVALSPEASTASAAGAMAARVVFANDLAPISTNYLLAMVFILFAYGGWNETAAVAAEVEIPQRNMLRGLTLGTGVVVACYLLVNVALLGGLGFDNLAASNAAVAELLQLATGDIGAKLISAAVCISCMGAINGMLFTGARLYYALGVQEPAFRWLGHWNQRLGTPVRTLVLQTLVAIGLIEVFGRTSDAFNTLVIFTTPVFWSFLLLVSIAVVVLRLSDPKTLRPFRLPFFPLEPLIFAAASGLMIYSSVNYMVAPFHERNFAYRFAASTAFVPAIAGLVVFLLTRLGAKRAKV